MAISSLAGTHTNPQLPGVPLEKWATDVLAGLGVPVTATNIDTLMKWATHESGGGNPNVCPGRYNPLNTTEQHFGSACSGGSQGDIRGFASYDQGVQNIVWNLSHGASFGYNDILAGFRASNQAATFAAINKSAFGTHGLGADSPIGGGGGGSGQPAGGTPGNPATLTGSDNPDDDCLVKLPGADLGIITLGGNCLVKRSQGRALLGAVALVAGVGLLLAGVALIGIGSRPARQALALIPGVRA